MTKHLFLAVYYVLLLVCMVSCNSGEKGKVNVEELEGVPFARTSGLDTTLVFIQDESDHVAVKQKMQELASAWKMQGVQRHEMYVTTSESNKVITFFALNDYNKAYNLVADESNLKPLLMQTNGSTIQTIMLDQELEYTRDADDTVLFFMSFKTMDYARWEKAFLDDFIEDPSKDFEVLKVFRGVDEPNEVYMFFLVNDPEYVQKMEKNNAFRMKMLASGVVSYPNTYRLLRDSI